MVVRERPAHTGLHRDSMGGARTEVRVNSLMEQRLALEHGFQPAFFDFLTQTIYPSVFADGTPAPFHVLEGLPHDLIVDRARSGRVISIKVTLLTGYERNGFFYTNKSVARAVAEWGCRQEA